MLVVSDTSPINYLVLIQQEILLPALYGRVVIPPAVYGELQRSQTPVEVRPPAKAIGLYYAGFRRPMTYSSCIRCSIIESVFFPKRAGSMRLFLSRRRCTTPITLKPVSCAISARQ
jgi:hypothetical protein